MHTLGQLFILAALAMNVVAGVSYFLQARGRRGMASLADRSYNLLTMFVTFAVIGLFYLFFSHDYSFKYVYEYSQRSQPFFYILSAFWGGQEGTYLLWLFFSVVFGYLLRRYAGTYREWAMALYCFVNTFLLMVLTKLSPFALLPFSAPDGAGLNPLLRDPWMVIHPPLMFVGYAMAALPFVLALAALIKGEYSHWLKIAFPWAAVTSVMLAAGNILGGFWAYKTLGWGGYWGWDPVENSSFVPWMISLALLHGMIIERRTGAFRRINILLSAFLFLLVVYGTFLTRSGVLSDFSVHSFVDLGVNVYLVGFMGLFFALTVILFAARVSTVTTVPLSYNVYGREFSLFGGLALLFITGVIVLFWSSLPVITSIIGIEPRAAEVETYNKFALPLAILFSLLLTYAPFSSYSERTKPPSMGLVAAAFVVSALAGFGIFHLYLGTEITFAVVFALVAGSVIMFALKPGALRSLAPAFGAMLVTVILCAAYGVQNYLYILFFVTAAMGLVSNLIAFAALLPGRVKISGAQVTHIGFTIMLIGILASSAYSEETKIQIDRGDTSEAFSRAIGYGGMENSIDTPYNKLRVTVESDSGSLVTLTPELYYSRRMDGLFKKPAIERSLLNDLYLAPAQVIELQSGEGLVLSRGEVARVGDMRVTFLDFDMGSHGSESNTLRAATIIEVVSGSRVDTIAPAVIQGISPDGESRLTDDPAALALPSGDTVAVSLRGIQADQGQVIIDIPGVTQSGPPDRLILDVALKPLINLVWGGAILILLGTCIVFYRRLSEMGRTSSGTV